MTSKGSGHGLRCPRPLRRRTPLAGERRLWTRRAAGAAVERTAVRRRDRPSTYHRGHVTGPRTSAPDGRRRSSTSTRRSSPSRARSRSAKPFQAGGLITRGAVLRSAYAQFVYLVGGADHDQMEKMRQFMSQLCAGWDVADGQGDRRRDAAQRRRPDRLRRGRRADRGAPPRRPRRRHRLAPAAPRWSSRSARCSAPTTWSPPGWRSSTASTPARSTTTPTPRTRRARSASWPPSRGYDLERCFAYSDSVTDVPMLEAVGHPYAVNPDKELRRLAPRARLAGAVFTRRSPCAAASRSSRPSPPSPSVRRSRSAGRSGQRAVAGSAPDRSAGTHAHLDPAESQALVSGRRPAYT